jgi:hypothetical protein
MNRIVQANTPKNPADILRPIASLVSKLEKAIKKVAKGSWQHERLQRSIDALRVATAIIKGETSNVCAREPAQFAEALRALALIKNQTQTAKAKTARGTSQHTLLMNRLNAVGYPTSRSGRSRGK